MTLQYAQSLINSSLLKSFVHPATNRCAYIAAWLYAQHIPYRTVTLKNKTHIIVTYNAAAYDNRYKTKTCIAHYDRAEGSPGANDNSAACIQLMLFARSLLYSPQPHNIRIIFTDGEESGKEGIREQGAYRLGQGLRALDQHSSELFVFDMCGSGDSLILSQSGIYGRDPVKAAPLSALHRRCCAYAEQVCKNHWFSLPTAYSDNAGFISAGLYAQVITVLPYSEAETLTRYMPGITARNGIPPDTANRSSAAAASVSTACKGGAALKHQISQSGTHSKTRASGEIALQSETARYALEQCIITNRRIPEDSPFAEVIPRTWQRMHTADDSIETLTPEAFVLVEQYLTMLAGLKELSKEIAPRHRRTQ
ncbi:MAG: M28 family peptidase [Treponema sp.]